MDKREKRVFGKLLSRASAAAAFPWDSPQTALDTEAAVDTIIDEEAVSSSVLQLTEQQGQNENNNDEDSTSGIKEIVIIFKGERIDVEWKPTAKLVLFGDMTGISIETGAEHIVTIDYFDLLRTTNFFDDTLSAKANSDST